jgi:hypothetical protein
VFFTLCYIIGEHGDSEVAVWSHTTVGGKPLLEFIVKNNRRQHRLLIIQDGFHDSRDTHPDAVKGRLFSVYDFMKYPWLYHWRAW